MSFGKDSDGRAKMKKEINTKKYLVGFENCTELETAK